jgi:hypothetical protein
MFGQIVWLETVLWKVVGLFSFVPMKVEPDGFVLW